MKILVFGTFDLVHKGHKYFLNSAKKMGDELIVVIARDKTVNQVKGAFPDRNEKQRKKDIEKLKIANRAVLGSDSQDKYSIIKKISPDIIALGYDQKSFTGGLKDELKKQGLGARIVRIASFKPEKYKSSQLKLNG